MGGKKSGINLFAVVPKHHSVLRRALATRAGWLDTAFAVNKIAFTFCLRITFKAEDFTACAGKAIRYVISAAVTICSRPFSFVEIAW